MARTRTTKAVAQRIDLNYFKRATPFKRAKLWLAILAPALAAVWIGWHFFGGDQRVYSSGRLSAAHAVLEKQCAACHVRDSGGFSAKAADAACLACHDGPAHHPEKTASSALKPACAECHTEHRGRLRLAEASSRRCAECHADLGAAGPGSQFAKNIRSFAHGHPEFLAVRAAIGEAAQDHETIRLNHALHMKAIRSAPNGPMVQLECGDCHRPALTNNLQWKYGDAKYAAATVSYTAAESFAAGGSRGLPTIRPWSDRQLMAPVKFANACAGCHRLTFDARFAEGVPHDRPDAIRAFLTKTFSEYAAAHPGEMHEEREPKRNLAGRDSGPPIRMISQAQWVADRVAISEELLWHKTCSQCHAVSMTKLQGTEIARWDEAGGSHRNAPGTGIAVKTELAKLPTVAAANVTLQWLPHARFDHDAHTGFACTGCHPAALKSSESTDVLIPGIATCETCHADGPGYASAQCSECHTYHDWAKREEVRPTFALPALVRGGE